jgi:UDP-4-amino-4,6-dideoxy-N-acetyl-beta-L-altrosamine transaminase
VLRSDFLTQGPAVPRFEQLVASQVRAAHAVAVNSATAALHIACLALGLGEGGRLWTVPNTFGASANCGRYCGAAVDFVDIDPATWNMNVRQLADKLVRARSTGELPEVVVPVHFSGQPTDQEAIFELACEFGFKVLEDASHAIGASRGGEPVGNCRWSHITVFSFHPVKIVTTGEGGMALTNDAELAERMAMFRSHGVTRERNRFSSPEYRVDAAVAANPPGWYYEQQLLGYNYRMTDIHAALGASQLARLTEYVERRNVLARRYTDTLRAMPLQLPLVQPQNLSAFHLYVIRLQGPTLARKSHHQVFDELRARGIGVNLHYMPVHLQPYYRSLGFRPGQFPEAEAYGASAITLPLYAAMTDRQQDEVMAALQAVL